MLDTGKDLRNHCKKEFLFRDTYAWNPSLWSKSLSLCTPVFLGQSPLAPGIPWSLLMAPPFAPRCPSEDDKLQSYPTGKWPCLSTCGVCKFTEVVFAYLAVLKALYWTMICIFWFIVRSLKHRNRSLILTLR